MHKCQNLVMKTLISIILQRNFITLGLKRMHIGRRSMLKNKKVALTIRQQNNISFKKRMQLKSGHQVMVIS